MSDILIKGMEMPKNCRTCPMLFDGHNYRWCNITGESLGIEETDNGRDEYCPLIELPPHSDLVDRNKLLAEYDRQHEGEAGKARKIMEQAKAVIEAEGSET